MLAAIWTVTDDHVVVVVAVVVVAVYTYVDIKLRVLSPSWTDELSDPGSAYYQEMVQAFCADVSTM